jgi:hypothetical protein
MKVVFSKQIFEKFNENPSSGGRVIPWRQEGQRTDKHDEANICLPQFCERAYKQTETVHKLRSMHVTFSRKGDRLGQ